MNKCKGCLQPKAIGGEIFCSDCRSKIGTLPERVQMMALSGLVALRKTGDLLPIDAFVRDMKEAHEQFLREFAGVES